MPGVAALVFLSSTFGVDWCYGKPSDEIGRLARLVFGGIVDLQGAEVFYNNIAAILWLHPTPDPQLLKPAREEIDTAVVLGFRVKADF
jgi:hypothetical protein